jgi:hypothetical protein
MIRVALLSADEDQSRIPGDFYLRTFGKLQKELTFILLTLADFILIIGTVVDCE